MKERKTSYLKVFIAAFFTFALMILPMVIYNRGYLVYYGDFNSQQLPFMKHMHDMISDGQFMWDWGTDLGSDFITSYSFYLLGSPFFWISSLFSSDAVLYTVPWILALKYAAAALTSYAYIRRFVKRDSSAVIGGLLYAFSGFQAYNIFFNHFHDTTALFPLMLIAMEEHITGKKRGLFAVTVALMAFTNYFFFAGQAVFLVIYFIIRSRCSDFRVTPAKFLSLFGEAVIGTCGAAVILVPSALSVLGNTRVSEHLYGMDMLVYSDRTRIPRIIQSFFMIPDSPARPNLFSEGRSKWSSIAGYLPMFSMTCVISFLKFRPDSWKSKLVKLCILCAFVPVLNSAFYMFNAEYYARWYYMPVLIMALITAEMFERPDVIPDSGFRVCTAALAAAAVISFLPDKKDDEVVWMAFGSHREYLYISLGLSALLLAACAFVFHCKKKGRPYIKKGIAFTLVSCLAATASVFYFGIYEGPYPDRYIAASINDTSSEVISGDSSFFRTDISEGCDNYPMFWGYPSMRCFQSTVSPSILDFYNSAGITRDVASCAETKYYAFRGLLSVKYYFSQHEHESTEEIEKPDMPGFEKISDGDHFTVYENTAFIPMGFSYDTYMTEENFEQISKDKKSNALLDSVLLTDEQAERLGGILEKKELKTGYLTDNAYLQECERKRNSSCTDFSKSSEGFEASFSAKKETLVFFSVPYDKGFKAYVNGTETDIENVNNGFMAVRVPAGESRIRFDYRTYGLDAGIKVSLAAAAVFPVYLVFCLVMYIAARKREKAFTRTCTEIIPDTDTDALVINENSPIDIRLEED